MLQNYCFFSYPTKYVKKKFADKAETPTFIGRRFLLLDRAVAHAAGGGQGGDGGGQDSDNHLNGLALDDLPRLFLDFVEDIHSSLVFLFEIRGTGVSLLRGCGYEK